MSCMDAIPAWTSRRGQVGLNWLCCCSALRFSALLFCIIDEAIENCFAEFPKVTVFDFRPWWAIEENVADSRLDKLYI